LVPIRHRGRARPRKSIALACQCGTGDCQRDCLLKEFQEAAMSHHWRSHVGRADVIEGAGDHDVEYFGGWVVSAALTLATVLVVWHFRI
jgi:hypothetical protein